MDSHQKPNFLLQLLLFGDDPKEYDLKSIILLIAFRGAYLLLLIGFILSTQYLPWRIWQTGSYQQQKVAAIRFNEGNRETPSSSTITTAGVNCQYNVAGRTNIQIGDTLTVFYSSSVNQGIITTNPHPSLFYILLTYENLNGPVLFMTPMIIIAVILGLFVLCREIWRIVRKIHDDAKEEIAKSTKPKSLWISTIKGCLIFFTNISFSYALAILMIKAVLKTERAGVFLVGIVIFFGVLMVATAPIIVYRLKTAIKEITNKNLAYSLQLLGLVVSAYGTFVVFRFINKYPLTQSTSIAKWLSDFLKSFLP